MGIIVALCMLAVYLFFKLKFHRKKEITYRGYLELKHTGVYYCLYAKTNQIIDGEVYWKCIGSTTADGIINGKYKLQGKEYDIPTEFGQKVLVYED